MTTSLRSLTLGLAACLLLAAPAVDAQATSGQRAADVPDVADTGPTSLLHIAQPLTGGRLPLVSGDGADTLHVTDIVFSVSPQGRLVITYASGRLESGDFYEYVRPAEGTPVHGLHPTQIEEVPGFRMDVGGRARHVDLLVIDLAEDGAIVVSELQHSAARGVPDVHVHDDDVSEMIGSPPGVIFGVNPKGKLLPSPSPVQPKCRKLILAQCTSSGCEGFCSFPCSCTTAGGCQWQIGGICGGPCAGSAACVEAGNACDCQSPS